MFNIFHLTSGGPKLKSNPEGNEAGREEGEGTLGLKITRGESNINRGARRGAVRSILPRLARWAGVGVFFAAGIMACDDDGRVGSASGTIDRDCDWDIFKLYTDDPNIDVTFSWPAGADFMVTVFGRTQNFLGEFHLLKDGTINLAGGGQFYIAVHSLNDTGYWSAYW
jgi:hypothetical protein